MIVEEEHSLQLSQTGEVTCLFRLYIFYSKYVMLLTFAAIIRFSLATRRAASLVFSDEDKSSSVVSDEVRPSFPLRIFLGTSSPVIGISELVSISI